MISTHEVADALPPIKTMNDCNQVRSISPDNQYTLHEKQETPITFEIPITPQGYEGDTDLVDLSAHEPRLDLPLSNAASLMKAYEGKQVQPFTDIKEKLFAILVSGAILILFLFVLFDAPKYKFIAAQMFCVFLIFHVGMWACLLYVCASDIPSHEQDSSHMCF
eukprot:788577_1